MSEPSERALTLHARGKLTVEEQYEAEGDLAVTETRTVDVHATIDVDGDWLRREADVYKRGAVVSTRDVAGLVAEARSRGYERQDEHGSKREDERERERGRQREYENENGNKNDSKPERAGTSGRGHPARTYYATPEQADAWTLQLGGSIRDWLAVAVTAADDRRSAVSSADAIATTACYILDSLAAYAGDRPRLAILDLLGQYDIDDFDRHAVLDELVSEGYQVTAVPEPDGEGGPRVEATDD